METYYIIGFVTVYVVGIATGMYAASQLEKKIEKRIKRDVHIPRYISVSYIEQAPQWFYGMYLYSSKNTGHYKKFSNIRDANIVLEAMGCDIKLPEYFYRNDGEKKLQIIKTKFNKANHGECVFDYDDCMDIS